MPPQMPRPGSNKPTASDTTGSKPGASQSRPGRPSSGSGRINQRFWGDERHSRIEDKLRVMVRPSESLKTMGNHSARGYDASHQAMDALHQQGVHGLHHHGRQMQESIRSLAKSGAKPEELKDLRNHLSGLSGALASGDKVKAHQSLLGLQHGFYAAHAGYEKEHGPGSGGEFPQFQRGKKKSGSPRLKAGDTLDTGSHQIKADEKKNFDDETHADVLKRHGYVRRGMGEYVHPKTKHSAIVQIGGISHHSPSGKQLGHFPTARHLDQHLTKVHSAGEHDKDPDARLRVGNWDHTIHFRSDDFNSLPQKPSPDDFTRAIGAAQNIKADKWDHRFINHEDLCPSEDKDPDEKLIKLMQDDPTKVPPIVVRANDEGKYDILDGHHRYAASKKTGARGMWAACVTKGSYA